MSTAYTFSHSFHSKTDWFCYILQKLDRIYWSLKFWLPIREGKQRKKKSQNIFLCLLALSNHGFDAIIAEWMEAVMSRSMDLLSVRYWKLQKCMYARRARKLVRIMVCRMVEQTKGPWNSVRSAEEHLKSNFGAVRRPRRTQGTPLSTRATGGENGELSGVCNTDAPPVHWPADGTQMRGVVQLQACLPSWTPGMKWTVALCHWWCGTEYQNGWSRPPPEHRHSQLQSWTTLAEPPTIRSTCWW